MLNRLSLNIPRRRLDGCACKSPLAHFYVYHGDSSLRELHPFTTITHLASEAAVDPTADTLPIQFLFRKRGSPNKELTLTTPPAAGQCHTCPAFTSTLLPLRKRRYHSQLQWTDKLASLVDNQSAHTAAPNSQISDSKSYDVEADNDPTSAVTQVRLEGPYFTLSDPAAYPSVVCLVAGTGISGALAIASAFIAGKEAYDLRVFYQG